jgi:DNA helicase-2/ATP-dependent DNA helicase PcrA
MLNPQQQAALDHCLTPGPSLNLIARAGCGKSYTLIAIASAVQGRVFCGAFNRSIADELKAKLPTRPGLDANTLHGAGLGAWRKFTRKVEVDGRKIQTIARKTWAMDNKVAQAADLLIGYAKLAGFGLTNMPYEDVDLWEQLIDHYDIEEEIPTTIKRKVFLESCVWTYEQSLEWCLGRGTEHGVSVLDFNDMLLAPLHYQIRLPQYDWFLMDEAQDTGETRRRLAIGMIGGGRNGGRMVAVGDPQQCIFFFAGASSDAMGIIERELHSTVLPLNVTYRCPRAIVELAQQWVPDFTAHHSAPSGTIRKLHHSDFWAEKFDPHKDVILCRYTRPLAGIAVTLRDKGVPCIVEGQSAKGLLSLVNKWGNDLSMDMYLTLLEGWENQIADDWMAKGRDDKAAAFRDRCGTVRAFAKRLGVRQTTKELARQIEMTFREQDRSGVLTLCTVHRSKGREWERVYLIGRNAYMPSSWAKTGEEIQGEENLQYVAITRTKSELVEVVVPESEPGHRAERDWWDLTAVEG